MENVILEANERKTITKASRNSIRNSGRVPGVYYSKHDEPISIDVNVKQINPLVFTSERHIIQLKVEGKEEHECILKNIQFDPITDKVVHFDLLGLTRGEKFQLKIPLQFIGNSIGIKEGGVLQVNSHKLFVECLPKDVPQSLEINIENLNIGDSIQVRDLSFDKIDILTPEDSTIVAITMPRAEEVVEEELLEDELAQPEVIGEENEEEATTETEN